jgi:PadR family transcriptional regulator, regulatory protein PadR
VNPLTRVTDAALDVLEVLIGPDEDLYGLKIAQLAGRKTGVVYPILARLEEAGWVDSFWERAEPSDRGPRRRFYQLNPGALTEARDLLQVRRGAIRQRSGLPCQQAFPVGRANSFPQQGETR